MTAVLIATLLDSVITIAAGIYLLVARRSLVARIADSKTQARVDTVLRVCAPLMIICALLLAAGKIANHEDNLSKLARQANAALPKLVDPSTRLDLVTVGKPRRLIFHLTALSGTAKDIDRLAWRPQKVRMEERARNGTDTKKLLGAGVTLVYRYSDRDGVLIDELVVSPVSIEKK